jgi:hypothetical protein
MKKQLRGGNSSIMKRGVLYGASSSNCLRMVLLRDKGIQFEADARSKKVFAIGHLNEDLFERDYLASTPDVVKEMEVKVGLSDNVDFCGHIDLTVPGLLYELKSCTSDNTYKKVFIEGKYKKENLIQLATYLLMTETPEGYLCYTSYTDKIQYKLLDKINEADIPQLAEESERETVFIHVTFSEDGKVLANDADSGIKVENIISFQEAAINVLENNTIYPDRPEPFDSSDRFTACSSCPLNSVCTTWEAKRWSTDKFVSEVKKALNISNED